MTKRNERGFIFIGFALVIAAVMLVMFDLALNKSTSMMKRYGDGQAILYTQELSVKFGQQIRYAYDIHRITPTCPSSSKPVKIGTVVTLCLVSQRICVEHPHDHRQLCITPNDNSLIAKMKFPTDAVALDWLIPPARADADQPGNPDATETSNSLVASPSCVDGTCASTCGVNADCLSYKFCPRSGSCDAKQFVWQTIALIK